MIKGSHIFSICLIWTFQLALSAPNIIWEDFKTKSDLKWGIYDAGTFIVQGENLVSKGIPTHFSEVQKIVFEEDLTEVPNPIREQNNLSILLHSNSINLELKEGGWIELKITNFKGQILFQNSKRFNRGSHVISLTDLKLSTGMYFLNYTFQGQHLNKAFTFWEAN